MNGRILEESTLAGRLAAKAVEQIETMRHLFRRVPDYADFRAGFQLLIDEELVRVRINELERCTCPKDMTAPRLETLRGELKAAHILLESLYGRSPGEAR